MLKRQQNILFYRSILEKIINTNVRLENMKQEYLTYFNDIVQLAYYIESSGGTEKIYPEASNEVFLGKKSVASNFDNYSDGNKYQKEININYNIINNYVNLTITGNNKGNNVKSENNDSKDKSEKCEIIIDEDNNKRDRSSKRITKCPHPESRHYAKVLY